MPNLFNEVQFASVIEKNSHAPCADLAINLAANFTSIRLRSALVPPHVIAMRLKAAISLLFVPLVSLAPMFD
jgi:hypothetical protein